ncbi:MAG: hypothetical protein KA105_00660 [Caulobacter sp.]|nr:hypothetical protein [Caulobacter sp.]
MNRHDHAHSRYRDGAATLAFGQAADGRIVHVRDVPSGLACGCHCPACGGRLIARRGQRVTAHFAHEGDAICVRAVETMLHLLAKEVLQERRQLQLPPIEAEAHGLRVQTHAAQEVTFDTAVLEQPLGGVTPDIIVRRGERELLVEIYVTHGCDAEKIAKIRTLEISAIEIDLRELPRNASRADIEAAVVSTAPRRWLFNPWVDEAARQAQAKVEAREAARQQRLDRDAAKLAANWDKLAATPFDDSHLHLIAAAKAVEAHGYLDHVGLSSSGARAFNAEPLIWQSVLLKQYVIDKPPYYAAHDGVSVAGAMATLRRHALVASLFDVERTNELIKRVRTLRPAFRTPDGLVRGYLTHLAKVGLLVADGGRWRTATAVRTEIDSRVSALEAARARDTELRRRVIALLRLSEPESHALELEAWLGQHLAMFDAAPADLARAGEDGWARLLDRLSEIDRAFQRGGPVPPLLELPLAAALRRAANARAAAVELRRREEAARVQAELDARADRLTRAAAAVFGHEADEWLTAPNDGVGEVSRLDAGRAADRTLYQLLTQLDQEQARRRQEAERAHAANVARAALRQAAVAAHGEAWAEVFLASTQPALRARPIDICVDEASLKRCLALIPPRRQTRRG